MKKQKSDHYKLCRLGYTDQWLEYGLLTNDRLLEQIQALNKANDKNTEHYRYATFRNYLATKETLTDLEFENYIGFALYDEDKVMSGAALIDLFTRTNLSDRQFDTLIAHMKLLGDWTKNTVARQMLLRRLKLEKLTDDLFRECFENGDNFIQEHLMSLANPEQLNILALQGRTKKIRNNAAQILTQKSRHSVGQSKK